MNATLPLRGSKLREHVYALGTILRFWHLDLKPLWLDQVITALFSLGRNYNDVPTEAVLSVKRLERIFSFNPAVSCSQLAHNLAN